MRARRFLSDVGPWPFGLAVMTFWLMVWAVLHAPIADYGIHVSVAERLIAGDRLYEEVWDNKDPLYFLSLAGARAITPLGGWFLEIVSLAATSISVYFLATAVGTSRRLAMLVGWVVAPVVVIGLLDATGGISPAVAAAFASIAFAARGRPFLSGFVLSAVPFFKITMFPVALTAVVVVTWFAKERWSRAALGFGLGLVLVLMLLALRQELLPYLNSLVLNVGYAQSGEANGTSNITSRLALLQNPSVQLSVISIVLALAIARLSPAQGNISAVRHVNRGLWWAAVWCLPSIALVLVFTGKWPGHAKLLMIPGVIAVAVVASNFSRNSRYSSSASFLVILLLGILIAALPSPRPFLNSLEYARAVINLNREMSSQAKAIAQTGPPSTYARVGQGQDPAHAIGLREWKLACPRFQQYWWENEEILASTRDCISRADVVLVTDDLYGPVTNSTWEAFQNDIEQVLSENFMCESRADFRVCLKVT